MNVDYQQHKAISRYYYFAYGSNMCEKQMLRRCPQAQLHSIGKLRDWEFMINERGVATLTKGDKWVWGVVYLITSVDLAYLDVYEGVKIGRYGRFYLPVEAVDEKDNRKLQTCIVYIDPSFEVGMPKRDYLERVISGAKQHGLPRRYIKQLKRWKYIYEQESIGELNNQLRLCLRDIEEGRGQPLGPTGD